MINNNKRARSSTRMDWIGGIIFTFLIAGIGYVISMLPGLDQIGQLACAIIIAVLYRNIFGYPEKLRMGITFSSKRLLRLAIILYGLKLNIAIIFQDGLMLLLKDALIITIALLLMIGLAKLFRLNQSISVLLGVGTGVCGAAAIAAIAPIMKAKEEDTAISVGIIALIGTVFAIGYTMVRPYLPFDASGYGIWSGMSLHEIAHVALATEPVGEEAVTFGLLTKLGRVLLLVPLSFLFMWFMKRKNKDETEDTGSIAFPWFLVGFLLCSLIGSYGIGTIIHPSPAMMNSVEALTTWLLTAAMVGLGLHVRLADLRKKSLGPLLAMIFTSLVLSGFVYFLV